MHTCRGCAAEGTETVLDLGNMPPADHFPPATAPHRPHGPQDREYPLAMTLCHACGLAQLDEDTTVPDEPRGMEPRALRDHARDAVLTLERDGWLDGRGHAREFGSPHGGTWLPMLAERGYRTADAPPAQSAPADVVLDCFGLMHEPDQAAAFGRRAAATAAGGVLIIQFHSLSTIITSGQWNVLRHGHFAYYSLTALAYLLARHGMRVRQAWRFPLYGGTVLLAATHVGARISRGRSPVAARLAAEERAVGVTDPRVVGSLGEKARCDALALREWLLRCAGDGRRVFGYGAASRSVALLHLAGADRALLAGVADASPAKQGRRIPGTNIPIISPDSLVAAAPDHVLVTVPDLLPELEESLPSLRGRWLSHPPVAARARDV